MTTAERAVLVLLVVAVVFLGAQLARTGMSRAGVRDRVHVDERAVTWRMHAARDTHNGGHRWFGARQFVQMHGVEDRDIFEVDLTENPEGPYFGWLGAAYLHYAADEAPVMIQQNEGIFDMQFAYGAQVEVEHGHGRIVRMTCKEVTDGVE